VKYSDGQIVQMGDNVTLGGKPTVSVCCISDGVYSQKFTEAHWSYLGLGVMIDFPETMGLIHFDATEDDEDLRLIRRAP
jgi:hypothetical protein